MDSDGWLNCLVIIGPRYNQLRSFVCHLRLFAKRKLPNTSSRRGPSRKRRYGWDAILGSLYQRNVAPLSVGSVLQPKCRRTISIWYILRKIICLKYIYMTNFFKVHMLFPNPRQSQFLRPHSIATPTIIPIRMRSIQSGF